MHFSCMFFTDSWVLLFESLNVRGIEYSRVRVTLPLDVDEPGLIDFVRGFVLLII